MNFIFILGLLMKEKRTKIFSLWQLHRINYSMVVDLMKSFTLIIEMVVLSQNHLLLLTLVLFHL